MGGEVEAVEGVEGVGGGGGVGKGGFPDACDPRPRRIWVPFEGGGSSVILKWGPPCSKDLRPSALVPAPGHFE